MEEIMQGKILTRTIAVRLTQDEYDVFERICERLNKSKSTFLRVMIHQLNDSLREDLENDNQ